MRYYRKNILIISIAVLYAALGYGQQKTRSYPEDIFKFPINPGQRNYLSGTMGELRGNHFHSGIDIKTYGKTGLPIYAIADGYVSRVKVSPYGYGKAIYVKHPKLGYTSVYAHCKKFETQINKYVQKKQYEKESFSVNLYPTPDMFPVKKGDLIAYSGNTGGSFGPHLHFEIRDNFQNVLNPLFFKFDEVIDDIPPSILKLKFVPLTIDSRVNGRFESLTVDVKRKSGKEYYISETPQVKGVIGIQIKTYDQLNGASNKNGVSSFQMYFDEKMKYEFFMESFSFGETRYLNRHVDYEEHEHHKEWLQKSYLDDGNMLDLYRYDSDKGKLYINDEETHNGQIKVNDAYGNQSVINFKLRGSKREGTGSVPIKTSTNQEITHKIIDNTLVVTVRNPKKYDSDATFYIKNKESATAKANIAGTKALYNWDLRKGLPDSVVVGELSKKFDFVLTIPSGQKFTAYNEHADIHFPRSSLYDTLYLQIAKDENNFAINDLMTPLFSYVHITLKPTKEFVNKAKTAVYSYDKKGHLIFEGGSWSGDKITFKTRSLGVFTILTDDTKPKVSRLRDNGNSIRFKIQDDLSGIDTYRATLDDQYVLMNYNYKTGVIWSERIDESKPMTGDFKLEITDGVGNKTVYTTKL